MSKIYTEIRRFMCECCGKPCDYYEECEYPPVYCNSRIGESGIEIKQFIKGRRDCGAVSFKSFCRRDDEIIKKAWNEKMLKEYVAMVKEKFPELQCDYDDLKLELMDMGIWEESE